MVSLTSRCKKIKQDLVKENQQNECCVCKIYVKYIARKGTSLLTRNKEINSNYKPMTALYFKNPKLFKNTK